MRWWLVALGCAALGCAEGGGRPPATDSGLPDTATSDGGRPDAVDVGVDVAGDASTDTGSDAPPTDAGPVTCTPTTEAAVCGGRSCVDGFCCDEACEGECRSCDLAGSEGTCADAPGSCDDGEPCTHTDTCAAGACEGTPIDCDGMDTTCRDFVCDGTATCASMARNLGGVCDDGNAATTGDVCQADGTCLGSAPGCPLPADACANGTQSRDGCGNARVIGRSVAGGSGFFQVGDTCSGRNRFDDCSWDAGNDHAFRIWLRTGETLDVSATLRDTCFSGYSATLKLYQSTGCSDVTCASDLWCEEFIDEGRSYTHTATQDGWHVIVVDGSTAFDDEGQYSLTVRLMGCAVAGCEC